MVQKHRKITCTTYKTVCVFQNISALKGCKLQRSNLSRGHTYIKSNNLPPWSLVFYSRTTPAMKTRLIRSDRRQIVSCAPVVNRHYLSGVSVGGRRMIDTSKNNAGDRMYGILYRIRQHLNYNMTLIWLMTMVSHMPYLLCKRVRQCSKRLISLKTNYIAYEKWPKRGPFIMRGIAYWIVGRYLNYHVSVWQYLPPKS